MNSYLVSGFFLFHSSVVRGYPNPLCSKSSLMECSAEYNTTVLPSHTVFPEEKFFNIFCPKINHVFECMKERLRVCPASDFGLNAEAVTRFYRLDKFANELCTPEAEFRKEYLKHSKCLRRHQMWLFRCFEHTRDSRSDHEKLEAESISSSKCLLWTKFESCMLETVDRYYGKEAKQMGRRILSYFKPLNECD